MKKLPLIIAVLTTITSPFCFAETESFNMTLNGDFSKDYCVLSVSNTSPSITIDSSALDTYPYTENEGSTVYYNISEPLNSTATVTCSAEEYKITLSDYTDYGEPRFGDRLVHILADHYIGGVFHTKEYINTMMSIGYDSTIPSVTIPSGASEAARFELFYKFSASEQDILNMPDSFSTALNYVISIDKLN